MRKYKYILACFAHKYTCVCVSFVLVHPYVCIMCVCVCVCMCVCVCVCQSVCLSRLDLCNVSMVDYRARTLSKALQTSHLAALHLHNAQLSGTPLFSLGTHTRTRTPTAVVCVNVFVAGIPCKCVYRSCDLLFIVWFEFTCS